MAKSALFDTVNLLSGEKILWEAAPEKRALWSSLLSGMWLYIVCVAFFTWGIIMITKPSEKSLNQRAREITYEQREQFDTLYYDSVLADLKLRESELEVEYEKTLFQLSPGEHKMFSAGLILFLLLIKLGFSYLAFRNRWFMVTSERVMIQSGILEKRVSIIDIDKINSIQYSQSFIEQKLKLCSVELVMAGVMLQQQNSVSSLLTRNLISGIEADSPVLNNLINKWLIRDNPLRG